MSIQWTAVAALLYFEIGLAFILCTPILSAKTWKKIFSIQLFAFLNPVWRVLYYAILLLLFILFLDSIREMNKFNDKDKDYDARSNLETKLDRNLKQFRAQRNFYITGMTLFLIIVIRRLMSVLSEQANLEAQKEAALKQAKNASDEANRQMEKAEKLSSKTDQEQIDKEHKEELARVNREVEILRKQAANNQTEYDRLSKENQKLQVQ